MEFDPSIHGQFRSSNLSTFSSENTTTPQPNNHSFQLNNTACVINRLNHSESSAFIPVFTSTAVLIEGVVPPASQFKMANPFYGVSTPYLGQSSFLHQDIPSNEQFIKDFINPANVNFAAENINASSHEPKSKIYNTESAKIILDFSQKIAVIPTQSTATIASSLHPLTPLPPVSSGGHGMMQKLRMKENLSCRIRKKNQRDNGNGKMRRQSRRAKTKNDCKSFNGITKGQWTPDEDRILKELVNKNGQNKWSQIAILLKGRIGKQCRERWHNHLQPNIKKGPWTLEEDIILIKSHKEFGNKWAKIAKRIPSRSENSIKNHWNTTKRSKDIKVHNKTIDEYDDSVLRAYIKDVTVAATGQNDKKTTTKKRKQQQDHKKNELPIISYGKDKAPMFSGLCYTDLGLTLRLDFPNHDFERRKKV